MAKKRQKPTLALLKGNDAFDIDSLMAMYKQLTGREPTNEEIEAAKRILRDNPDSDVEPS
jgi:hypothetical protein